MPQFTYKAEAKDGSIKEGVVEADDRFGVYAQVRKEGRTVLSVEQKGESLNLKRFFDVQKIDRFFSRVTMPEKIMLSRNLAAMLEAGLPLSRALGVLERQSKNLKLKEVMRAIGEDIKKGSTLHAALAKFPKVFSPLFVSMTRAGEESGGMAESLRVVSTQMAKAYALRKKIRGALVYPSIVVVAMIAIGVLMLIYVVPTLTETFEELDVELPNSTQAIITASDFLVNNTLLSLLLMVFIVAGFATVLRTRRGQRAFELFILNIPIIGELVKQVNAARTARTLSSLLSAGVEIVTAIGITADVVQNSYYKDVLVAAKNTIQKGSPLSDSFKAHEDIYPVLVGEMVAVGEETGELSKMLRQVAEFYEDEVEQRTKNMTTIIEPFLMLFIGTVVGFFAISMISPIYSISSGI